MSAPPTPPGPRGADNVAVLRDVLSLAPSEIEALERARVLRRHDARDDGAP